MGLVVFFGLALFVSPVAVAGDKQFVCHITYVDCDGSDHSEGQPRVYGHVIYVAERALAAHCAHGDHYPSGVVEGNDNMVGAEEKCVALGIVEDTKEWEKCVALFSIGQSCGRRIYYADGSYFDKPVLRLCGEEFEPVDICPSPE